jgi:hypothetical protein
MRVCYMAHPLGADAATREANRQRAQRWYKWIIDTFDVAVCADWIIGSGLWDERQECRDYGLAMDVAIVSKCDEIWLVGGRISPGMQTELQHAVLSDLRVVDLTFLGPEPPGPEALVEEVVRIIAPLRKWITEKAA